MNTILKLSRIASCRSVFSASAVHVFFSFKVIFSFTVEGFDAVFLLMPAIPLSLKYNDDNAKVCIFNTISYDWPSNWRHFEAVSL